MFIARPSRAIPALFSRGFWTVFFIWPLITPCAGDDSIEVPPDHAERMKLGLQLFKEHVREDLARSCLECHGGKSTKAEFDLSDRNKLLESGYVADTSDESYLLQLITHEAEPHMPYKRDRLDNDTIGRIARWIDLGAPYDRPLAVRNELAEDDAGQQITDEDRAFWSFAPLKQASPPMINDAAWVRNPIDDFILAEQEARDIVPSAPLSKRMLVRRAFLDVIGLPPSPEQLAKYCDKRSPIPFSEIVDELLESPHYGERWGRHWLDVARFAESHGFEQDYDRSFAFHYRDFVIEALNQDMPFDQFVRWQIAGDELAPSNPLALKATGFLGAGVFPTQITAREVERVRYDALDDMLGTTSLAVLGLTVGCARCHDHKFDPIPASDYYSMLSAFTTTVRGNVELSEGRQRFEESRVAYERDIAVYERLLERREVELEQSLGRWLASPELTPTGDSPWKTINVTAWHSSKDGGFTALDDGSLVAENQSRGMGHYMFEGTCEKGDAASLRVELLPLSENDATGPGNVSISEVRVLAGSCDYSQPLAEIQLVNARTSTTVDQAKALIDGDTNTHWSNDAAKKGPQVIVVEFDRRIGFDAGTRWVIILHSQSYAAERVKKVRFAVSSAPLPVPFFESHEDHAKRAIAKILADDKEAGTLSRHEELLNHFKWLDPEYVRLSAAKDKFLGRNAPIPPREKAMVCSEGISPIRHHTQGADFFEKTYVLNRGDPDQKQREATLGFLQVLSRSEKGVDQWKCDSKSAQETSGRRSTLANWLTDTEFGAGHLTARVIANRLWHHHFGRGIVSTPSDFGFTGERPTHPELLDWLAGELIRNDWRLKPLHRLIMNSATYQQGVVANQRNQQRDPENQLWWKVEPRRLEAEIIRDNLLAVSGTLNSSMFGPGTLFPGHERRSIYFTVKRSRMIPMLQIFDWPDALGSTGSRQTTTTASQALVFLNDPEMKKYALTFADRLDHETNGTAEAIVNHAYEVALARSPTPDELNRGMEFLIRDESSTTGKPDLQAVREFSQVIMSLNEFIYIP